MLRFLQSSVSQNSTSSLSASPSSADRSTTFLYFGLCVSGVLGLLILVFLVFKRFYSKFHPRKRRDSQTKLKKAEAMKSIYDDKFGIIENENENIRDKSMIKEFLEANNLKKDEIVSTKDDKNFYISAKNVFNIEGEESVCHYENSKRSHNKDNSRESNEIEDEMGQFSQEIERGNEENSRTDPENKLPENSILNALN